MKLELRQALQSASLQAWPLGYMTAAQAGTPPIPGMLVGMALVETGVIMLGGRIV